MGKNSKTLTLKLASFLLYSNPFFELYDLFFVCCPNYENHCNIIIGEGNEVLKMLHKSHTFLLHYNQEITKHARDKIYDNQNDPINI